MPLERVWRRWFEEVGDLAFSGCLEKPGSEFLKCARARREDPIGRQQLYMVYVHSRPDFLGYPPGHLFNVARICAQAACRCRCPARSVVVNWRCCAGYELVHRTGSGWLVATAAMYTLLKAAVNNPVNQFFVLLSEACLPLYPPSALYLQIIHEPRSRTNGGCELGGRPTHEIFRKREVAYRRRLGETLANETAAKWSKASQWFLLNQKHAELAAAHDDDWLLATWDEWYISTLLASFNASSETTCDWQGPTYVNWTWGEHPENYAAVDGELLHRMRLSSIFAGVRCDWRAALSQANDPGRFVDLRTWDWKDRAPAFVPMNSTCPLFARKMMPKAQASYMAALWLKTPIDDSMTR